MIRRLLLLGFLVITAGFAAAACSDEQREALQSIAALATANHAASEATPPAPVASIEPLNTPTLDPIAAGPMGTWTALAQTIVTPTQNTEPYVIVNRGNPHFIEFHAWW